MLIHSCLYYELDESIVSDHKWQEWADELEKLQREHPQDCKIGFFDREFYDWSGTTGAHLNHRHPWTMAKAKRILEYHRGNNRIEKKSIPEDSSLEKFFG